MTARPVRARDLYDTEQVAARLGVRPASLRAMRAQAHRHRQLDGLPAPLRTISGRPVWAAAEVERWLAAR